MVSLACNLLRPTPTLSPSQPVSPSLTAVSQVTPAATPTITATLQARQPLPPALVETSPLPGSDIPLKGSLTLVFNQPMNQHSVEAAIQSQPSQGMVFKWTNDSTLVLTPDQPYIPGSKISLTIGTTAKAAIGLELSDPVTLEFQASGTLQLAQTLPLDGAADVDPSSAIVASFNRPVVALGADVGSLPAAFTLDPHVEGKGEWINTSTYIFYPKPSLAGGTQYKANLNTSLTSIDGAPLDSAAPAAWSFTTPVPAVATIDPVPGSFLRLDNAIAVTFNVAMNPDSLPGHFSLSGPNGESVPGQLTWDDSGKKVTFKPDALLQRDSDYVLKLTDEVKARGGIALGSPVSETFKTYPNLAFTASKPANGKTLDPSNGGYTSVTLYFSAPLAKKNLKNYFTFTPPVSELSIYLNNDDTIASLTGYFQYSTRYNLEISTDLLDAWGDKLGESHTLQFSTSQAAPALSIPALYYANGLAFLTQQDAGLPANATNLIANIGMLQGSITLAELFELQDPQGNDALNAFTPAQPVTWNNPVKVTGSSPKTILLPLNPSAKPLAPGLYYLGLQTDVLPTYNANNRLPILLVVSPVQLTLKLSATDATVWAVNLSDRTPVSGSTVTVYDEKGQPLGSGQTDAQGLLHLTISTQADAYQRFYAISGAPGEKVFGMAISSWNQGLNGYDFGLSMDYRAPGPEAYVYTDRPIYRPGQTVSFRAVVRTANNGRFHMIDLGQANVRILGDAGISGNPPVLLDKAVSLTGYGSLSDVYALPASASPGFYTIEVKSGDNFLGSVSFQVANYRKPEINLQLDLQPQTLQRGQTLAAAVKASYFFGAPAGGLPVSWSLYRTSQDFILPGYQVGPLDTSWISPVSNFMGDNGLGTFITQGQGVTLPDGSLNLSLNTGDLLADAPEGMQRLTLEATIQDDSGRPVSQRASVLVHPADYYIGIRPDSWTGSAEQALGFNVQTVNTQGQPDGSHKLEAAFTKIEWVEQEATDPLGMPVYLPQTTALGSASPVTDNNGQARLSFTPPEPGTYQLEVTGSGTTTQVLLWVGGPGEAAWPNLPDQKIRLTADASSYQPGQTAQVFIPNPFPGDAQALVTVERGIVMRSSVISVTGSGTSYSLPLSEDDAPNVYLSVTLLGSTQEGKPDFRQGYINIPVDPAAQFLHVKLVAQPAKLQAGQPATISVQVSDAQGKPVQGEFSLAVADLAALALADPNTPGIKAAYYNAQPLGVRTSLSLGGYAGRDVFIVPGRGGGGGGNQAPQVVRQDFPDTAYWNGAIVTDANGMAQVTFDLPDNLTTWQAEVRGVSGNNTLVGETDVQLVTSKDLLVRPQTPRFLVAGDHTQLTALVNNTTTQDLKVEATLDAAGVTLDDPANATQAVDIPAVGQAKVTWWTTVQDVAEADLVFSVKSGSLSDAARPDSGKLPIRRYTSPQTFSTGWTLTDQNERLEVVSLPTSFTPLGGELSVELSPSLASVVLKGLDALDQSGEMDNSTALSRFLPNLIAYRTLQELGIDSPTLQSRFERTANEGVRQLVTSQNGDGGWSWWSLTPDFFASSDPYLSAYILFGLSEAKAAGIAVNDNTLQQAVQYLQKIVALPKAQSEGWKLDRLAFQIYALQRAGSIQPELSNALFEQRDRLSPWAKAMLLAVLLPDKTYQQQVTTLQSDLEATAIRSATGVHWESPASGWYNPSTPLFTSAVVVYTLAGIDPANPLLSDAVRYLAAGRDTTSAWGSTYETAWVLLAFIQVFKGTGDLQASYDFSAELNGSPLLNGQAGGANALTTVTSIVPLGTLYNDGPNALRIRRDAGTGRLYYRADLTLDQPAGQAQPIQRGLTIERAYYVSGQDCAKTTCQPVSETRLSSDPSQPNAISVRLTLTLPHDMYNLMVEDTIPAGTEIFNPNLKTSQQGLNQQSEGLPPLYDPTNPYSNGWGWWYFADPQISDDHVLWTASYLPAGTYQLTYRLIPVVAGEYQVIPARAWEFYFPEVQGSTAGAVFAVKDLQ